MLTGTAVVWRRCVGLENALPAHRAGVVHTHMPMPTPVCVRCAAHVCRPLLLCLGLKDHGLATVRGVLDALKQTALWS